MGSLAGVDSEGKAYANPSEMWREEAGEGAEETGREKKKEWYSKGISYWENVPATVDGVLGGYGDVSSRDVIESRAFLKEITEKLLSETTDGNRTLVALDCGAGVGRVTKSLLLPIFHEVDLVEPVRHFIDAAQQQLHAYTKAHAEMEVEGDERPGSGGKPHQAVNFFCCPLQDFSPAPARYDVIWVQWCIGHLTDADLLAFFNKAKAGLKPTGLIFLKENTCHEGFVVDKEDSSVTRSDAYFRSLFRQADLHLIKSRVQSGFPEELFVVRMYALSPVPVSQWRAATAAEVGHGDDKPIRSRLRSEKKRAKNLPAVIY